MPNETINGVSFSYQKKVKYKISKTAKNGYLDKSSFCTEIKQDISLDDLDPDPSGILYVYSLETDKYTIFGREHQILYIGETHDQKGDVNGRFLHHFGSSNDCASNDTLRFAYDKGEDIILDIYVLSGGSRKDIENEILNSYVTSYGHLPIGNGKK